MQVYSIVKCLFHAKILTHRCLAVASYKLTLLGNKFQCAHKTHKVEAKRRNVFGQLHSVLHDPRVRDLNHLIILPIRHANVWGCHKPLAWLLHHISILPVFAISLNDDRFTSYRYSIIQQLPVRRAKWDTEKILDIISSPLACGVWINQETIFNVFANH